MRSEKAATQNNESNYDVSSTRGHIYGRKWVHRHWSRKIVPTKFGATGNQKAEWTYNPWKEQ